MKASLVALLFAAAAHAQDAAAPAEKKAQGAPASPPAIAPARTVHPDWQIYWEVQAITLPTPLARPLFAELRDETTSAEGWKKVAALVQKKAGELTFETGGQILDDRTAEFSRTEEIRYPAENERPEVVGPVQTPAQPAVLYHQDLTAPKPVRFPIPKFDTRKVGYLLSVDGDVSDDGKRLSLGVSVEHTWLLQWDEFEVGRLANNEKIIFKQPRFASVKREGKNALFSGERALLTAHEVPGVAGKTELIFLHAWTTPREKTEAK